MSGVGKGVIEAPNMLDFLCGKQLSISRQTGQKTKMWEEACGTGVGCYVIESSHRSREASISKPVHYLTAAIKARRKTGLDFLCEKWRETRYLVCRAINLESSVRTSRWC